MELAIAAAALIVGFAVGYLVSRMQHRSTQEAISQATEALRQSVSQERQLDVQHLEGKKGLIDQQLGRMTEDLRNIERLMSELEKGRSEQFGQIGEHLQTVSRRTAELSQTTADLHRALSSTKVRGQWGERMAEDILQLMGFQKGVSYDKQISLGDSRPDFSFVLPNSLRINMDVKFPWDNYKLYVEASTEADRQAYRKAFLRDVRERVKEVASRGYINDNTVDCVLMFIPNEHIYAFVHDEDHTLMEDALTQKVVLCSPITLFAVLAVVRQAVTNFQLEKRAGEMSQLMRQFYIQWKQYTEQFSKVERKLGELQREFQALVITRQRALEQPLARIEALRQAGKTASDS